MDIDKFSHLILQTVTEWINDLVRLLPNFFMAAVVLVVGFYLAGRVKLLALGLIRRISFNPTFNSLFGSVIYLLAVGITVFTVLSILQLDKAVTSILAGAGIVGLALAFAFQDIAANFISGIFITFRRPLRIGDIVKVRDYMGKVVDINLRDTTVRTFQGQMVIIPNKDVFQNPIENYSLLGKRRIDLEVGVSYGEDLERVRTITLEAVRGIPGLADDEETTLFYREFSDSSINFILRLWMNSPEQPVYMGVGSEAIIRIKKAYDANKITIPFPIRTLDFGIKGGVQLKDMPLNIGNESRN